MTPLKDISGFERNLQGIKNEDKIRQIKSSKNKQISEENKINDKSEVFKTKDRVDISSKGISRSATLKEDIDRYVREIKQLPTSNARDLANIQERVSSNFYSKPEVLDKVTDSLIMSFRNSHISSEKIIEKKSLDTKKIDQIREQIKSGAYNTNKILDVITDEISKII